MSLTTYHLLVVAVVAAVLTACSRKLVRDGFGAVLVVEYVWLAVVAVGDLVGLGRNQPFNNLLFPGLLLVPFLWFAPTIWGSPKGDRTRTAAARSLRPAWVLVVGVCAVFVWFNLRNV